MSAGAGLVPLVVDRQAVAEAADLPALVEELRRGYAEGHRAAARTPHRTTVAGTDPPATFGVMPSVSSRDGLFVTKLAALVPDRPAGEPAIHALSVVMSTRTGRPLAVLDGAAVTDLRCAAVTALVTDLCTPDRPLHVGLVGSGVLARQQVRGMCAVRPLASVTVTSRRAGNAEAFARWAAGLVGPGCRVEVADRPADVVDGRDVIGTATGSVEPLIVRLPPGPVHVNCMGAHAADRREVASDLLREHLLLVEDRELAVAEAGPAHRDATDLGALLADLPADLALRTTVFSSTGDPWADLVTAAHVLRRVRPRVAVG
ncbi:ornithine cyclodeaminase family protein [Micromonospora sp. NPDC051300]|uniref:ornithine cyclodeaminase family protein n=1 Tax=Micromonospora sp. NPDC051300 TaxID=3364286 RepID=UPI0037BC65EC